MGVELTELAARLDEYLRIAAVPDYPQALNGLQVESPAAVRRVAAAVDASEASILAAAAEGANLLVVHHGLFWDGNQPLTGRRYRRVAALLSNEIALYSAHIPLDVHPEVGNSHVLARELGVQIDGMFGDYKGIPLGVHGRLEIGRDALCARLDESLGGRVKLVPGGGDQIKRVGVVTGGAADMIHAARAAGLDAFITGEGSHHHFFDAAEGNINLYLGGHYATETWGVRALGEWIAEEFDIPTSFIDLPTGL